MVNNKPKILFCLPAFTFGGTVFSTLNMISFLKKDYDIYVLPMTYQGPVKQQYMDNGVKLLPEIKVISYLMGQWQKESGFFNKLNSIILRSIRRIGSHLNIDFEQHLFSSIAKKLERKYKFDFIASCQEGASTYFVSCFQNKHKIAWFRSEYSIYRKQLTDYQFKKEKKIYGKFDKIVCVSNVTKDDFIRWFPNNRKKTYGIHNIQFTDRILRLSNENVSDNFNSKTFNIVSIGRFAPQKRFSSIPLIARELKDQGLDFTWYIIGDGNRDNEYNRTIEAIEKFDVNDKVKCIGSRLNPYPYIKMSDLMVCPSYYEACPRVVIESKILHIPVICADFSSSKEFISNGINGYIDKIDNLTPHIATLITDFNLYQRIKENCNKYAIDNNIIYQNLQKIFS